MAGTENLVLFDSKYAETADTEQFVSPPEGNGTVIDKFTATNQDSTTRSFTVRLVPPAGGSGVDYAVITKNIAPGECYLFPQIVGQTLNAGGAITTQAAVANKILIRASGRNYL